jgi:hypothetical protein
VAVVFRRIIETAGRLDILVNVAWGGYEQMVEDGETSDPRSECVVLRVRIPEATTSRILDQVNRRASQIRTS